MSPSSRLLALIVLLSCFAWGTAHGDDADLQVLSSIKPISLIVSDLGGDWLQSETLLPANASPHDFALRVSDMRRINQADLVLWLGPSMERFLEKPLAGRKGQGVMSLLAKYEADGGEEHGHENNEQHEYGEAHQDPHLWLDPSAASEFAVYIAEALIRARPSRAEEIKQKLTELKADYAALHRELEQQLAGVKQQPFLVYHRGFDPLVERFGLHQLNWVTITPEQPAGARHLARLEGQIKAERPRCLFTDTTHPSGRAETLAAQHDLQLVSLDILGSEASSYRGLMLSIGQAMATCLKAAD